MHVRKSRDDGVTRMFLRRICFSISYESRGREVTRLHAAAAAAAAAAITSGLRTDNKAPRYTRLHSSHMS